MKKANFAPIYCALYPELSEIARSHGYALSVHGSMARDFDLVCIPWVKFPSKSIDVVNEITNKFSVKIIGDPVIKEHGRESWTLSISFGECFFDLSFMPLINCDDKNQ